MKEAKYEAAAQAVAEFRRSVNLLLVPLVAILSGSIAFVVSAVCEEANAAIRCVAWLPVLCVVYVFLDRRAAVLQRKSKQALDDLVR